MKSLLALGCLVLVAACGSGGPPPPDWKTDAADLIEIATFFERRAGSLLDAA